ncbi:MAG: Stk1 family PASTA domain-containing Ser/Thr kinase [Firmicutes bacterium]|nr:Stk1 family PASTA domain-containing Ser/Thr kinase [Blautia sp.]MDD7371556.1 Stk1 family PASTA domain-containing Ser/Thr kinase [Bacillota bacterium]MDY3715991.1 Stk1 family PASTA domain-containing Ser/Thr kinase [Blautia sp.]
MLNVGVIVGDRYEIVSKVGSGGMADVYKAKDHKLNRFVAMKVMKPEFSSDTNFISKFQREAQAAAGLAHPNVVNVFDVGEDQGVNYIVMELVEGITLKEYISKKGKLTVKEATSIAIQVAMGLEAAHNRNIVHRDIKPQNIIISTDGKVKVTDFGIARAASSNTISTNAMGSVHYSSPEQVRGGYSDYKSDIYSLGITMYEMVTGMVPFDGDTTVAIAIKHLQEEMIPPSEITPDLPHSLEEIIMKCTQKSPDRRYSTLAELINDLKHSLIDPNGNFVNLTPLSNHAQTVVISPSEMEQIKRGAVSSAPQTETFQEDSYDSYGNTDYDDSDDYDSEDDYDEEDDKGGKGISSKLEKAMTIGGLVVGAIIICILVYTIASATGLLKFGSGTSNKNKADTETTSNTDESDETTGQIEVPDLTKKTPEEAQKALNELQLGYKNGGEEASDTVEEGLICRQDVEAGSKVSEHTLITCYISSGTQEIEMPDVTDKTQTEAEAMLKELGLKTTVQKANSSTITIGNVVSTDPVAGTQVKAGDTVILTISIGEGDTAVRVPDVIGWSEADAKASLSQAGLLVTVQTGESQRVNVGEVYDMSISSGTRVDTGTAITIYVRGEQMSTTDNQEQTDNENTTAQGGTWKPANSLSQPADYQGGKVKVELVQEDEDGNTYSDQSMEVDDPQFPLSIQQLTGQPGVSKGTAVLYEWIGDSYQVIDQYEVTFQKVD